MTQSKSASIYFCKLLGVRKSVGELNCSTLEIFGLKISSDISCKLNHLITKARDGLSYFMEPGVTLMSGIKILYVKYMGVEKYETVLCSVMERVLLYISLKTQMSGSI